MTIRYCLLPLILGLSLTAFAQTNAELRPLVPGQPVERQIAGGETHTYQISLTAGQFARVVLEQKAIDVALVLTAPDGKQVVETNLAPVGGLESLSAEAAASGNYRLTVRAASSATLAGSYQVRLEVKAAATAQDRQRIAAERWMLEARELRKQPEQAIDKLQQALSVWRELGDQYWAARSLYGIGFNYSYLSRYEKALEYYEQALTIYREVKNRAGEGVTLATTGYAYSSLGRYDKAIEFDEQALAIHREVKDRDREGTVLGNLANAYNNLGRYEKAIEFYEQALAITREVKDRQGEGVILGNLGNAYHRLSRYEKAIEFYEQALANSREVKDREGEGVILGYLGDVYNDLGRYEKAIEFDVQALAITREVNARFWEAATLNHLGLVYNSLRQPEKAITFYEQALAISREIKHRWEEFRSLNGLGSLYRAQTQYEKAIQMYQQALDIARRYNERQNESWVLENLAMVERERGNLAAARTYIEESLRVVESMRSDILSPESRSSFLANVQSSYQLYIDVLMRQHRAEPTKGFDALAVETSERQRARSFLDLLTEARADVRQGVEPTLIERERSLGKQLNDKAQRLTQANKPEEAAVLKQEISQLENDYERAQADIRKASPHYAALTQPQPLKLKEVQAQLDADTLLLEYALGEERSYVWAITKDSLTGYELPKDELIENNARQVYELLTARSINKRGETARQRQERVSQAEAKLPAAAQELSQTILAPVAAQLGNKRLVIVADGALQYIPFAMLPDPSVVSSQLSVAKNNGPRATSNGQPLIVKHEVVSLPSASAFALQRTELAGRQLAPKTLAVIADPVFDRSDSRFTTPATETGDKTLTQAITGDDARSIEHLAENSADKSGVATLRLVIPRLPFTRQEANQLMALAPKGSSFSAIDFQANRGTVLNGDLSQYRYVHFATHGYLDSERPGLSALLFSMVDAQGKPQDGFLRANDIYNLKLPAELVVLSACQTGLGKEIKGEGLVGLTRGFMYAGAARVVVSLWNVNDKATADLMT
ncbi:MAG TPA: tetratricopeptide repeat protein, partial [Pyrinomonadaceae bacterium]|nr:tetratricopeptide repeat protein [Pyrinomonadaceae bacterium]